MFAEPSHSFGPTFAHPIHAAVVLPAAAGFSTLASGKRTQEAT
jgi:hypothetical protein